MNTGVSRQYPSVYVTRYMGAKYKLLDLIVPAIERLSCPGSTVVDLMAGTHSVGYALKGRNVVFANDIQAYSEVFGIALLLNSKFPIVSDRVLRDFQGLDGRNGEPGWFTEVYRDTYFSESQCVEIENLRERIADIHDRELQAVYLLALCSAMSLCQSSPGHFAQFMPAEHPRIQKLRSMSVGEAFLKRCLDLHIDTTNLGNRVFRLDSTDLLGSDLLADNAPPGSVLYLDPPYSSAQYSRYYHLLETVVLDDKPEVSFKALYRQDRYQSPFCSSTRAYQEFFRVISASFDRGWPIVISYSSHGLVKVPDLLALLKANYPKVSVAEARYNHSMQGRGVAQDRIEYVFSGSWD